MTMKCMYGRESIYALVASSLLASCANQTSAPIVIPAHAVVGVQPEQLTPAFWIARESNASKIVLDRRAISAQGARLFQVDPSVHDLAAMPQVLTANAVRSWIEKLSGDPDEELFDAEGRKLERPDLDALKRNLAL